MHPPLLFWQLAQLTTLNIAENSFKIIPPVLGLLPSLTSLDMSGNELSDIQNISKLTSMEQFTF